MTELYPDHLEIDGGSVRLERVADLERMEYRPEIKSLATVPSASNDHAYLCVKASALTVPFPEADIAADRETVYLCSCSDFYFHRSNGVENGERTPDEIETCKHLRAAFREVRAESDDRQVTL